jgi:hypothetical protein
MSTVVEVVWDDAWVDSDSMSVKAARKSVATRTHSVGFLVSNTDEGITMATDTYEKDRKNVRIVNFIPHCMIVSWYRYVVQ